jgi:hypothetical protein
MDFSQYILHFAPNEDYLSYFRSSAGGLPVVLQYVIPYCKGLSLGPLTLMRGTAVGNVFPFWTFPSLCFF